MSKMFESLNVSFDKHLTPTYLRKPAMWRPMLWLLRLLQRRCQHPKMVADIMEGQVRDQALRWCPTCGAVSYVIDGCPAGEPRICEPTWT